MLDIIVRYHCMQFRGKPRKTNKPNLRKWQKNLVWGPILANFLFKNLASSVNRYHGQLSSCKISEKN